MKGTIYVIKNKITNECYVGKTYNSLELRFREHIRDSKKQKNKKRKLYQAINKYGIDNFTIFPVFECEESELELKEIEYIKMYDSYKNGYNSTLGGNGRRYIEQSNEEIIKLYKELGSARKVALYLGISEDTTRSILNKCGFDLYQSLTKAVMINETGDIFDSVLDCAEYLIKTEKTQNKNRKYVARSISRVITGGRKSYLGYTYIHL